MPDIDLASLADETTWSTEELQALGEAVAAELGRRWNAETAAERARDVQDKARGELDRIATSWHVATRGSTGTLEEPVPYEAPTGAHDVWPTGSVVTHVGRVWRNPHSANSWEPGAVGSPWVDVTPAPAGGELLPWGTGQVVAAGDKRSHEGRVWAAKIAHTTHAGWPPSPATHAVWTDLGPTQTGA